jgi:hypothetical protein
MMDAVKTVLAGFIGIRRRHAHDRAQVRPAQIIVVAIVFVVLFVAALRTVVHFITS